jgi:hypothetical protein
MAPLSLAAQPEWCNIYLSNQWSFNSHRAMSMADGNESAKSQVTPAQSRVEAVSAPKPAPKLRPDVGGIVKKSEENYEIRKMK